MSKLKTYTKHILYCGEVNEKTIDVHFDLLIGKSEYMVLKKFTYFNRLKMSRKYSKLTQK